MAAHALTIHRQIRLRYLAEGAEAATRHARDATNAPGTDIGSGCEYETWAYLDRGDGTIGEPALLSLDGIERHLERHLWMAVYPTLESVKAARALFVRCPTPGWQRRSRSWERHEDVRVRYRRKLAEQDPIFFPMTRLAPVIEPQERA
jgi:hypothetical protein